MWLEVLCWIDRVWSSKKCVELSPMSDAAISCHLWSSVYKCQRVECVFTSPVRTECGMFVIYCMQCCMSRYFVVRGCAVSKRYINVCNCDMFSVVNVYLDHLQFCVVCVNVRRYVCCSECNVVSNESTSCLMQPIGTHGVEVMYFGLFALGVSLVS